MDEEFSAGELAQIRDHQGEETGTSFLTRILSEKGMAWASLVVTVVLQKMRYSGATDEEILEEAEQFASDTAGNVELLRPHDYYAALRELMDEVDHFLQIGMKEFLKGAEDGAGADES